MIKSLVRNPYKTLKREVDLKYGIILMQSFQLDIESIQKRQHTFVYGLETF